MPLVRALPAVELGQFDSFALDLVDGTDMDAVGGALVYIDDVCEGHEDAGSLGQESLSTRFGFIKAPRSTVVQPGPVHGGITDDPRAELNRLLKVLVELPDGDE